MSEMLLWVTTSFTGFHRWIEAPDEVAYLRDMHRHKFNIMAAVQVDSSKDRVFEFHMFQKEVSVIVETYLNIIPNVGSCESIAKYIASELKRKVGDYKFTVMVDEDGECGVTFTC